MSQFWEQRLADIREQLLLMSGLVERVAALSLQAFVERNDRLCDEVEATESRIDQLEIHVDEMVVTYMATHAPTARDCRMMLTASKIAANLERVADEATKITRSTRHLNTEPMLKIAHEIPIMGEVAHEMLRDSITAFLEGNNELAVEVIARDRSVDSIRKELERTLVQGMQENARTIKRALHLTTITRAIERMADHATNIAEESFYFHSAKDIRHDPALKGRPAGRPS